MALFGFGKKKKVKSVQGCCRPEPKPQEAAGCCCNSDSVAKEAAASCAGASVAGICCIKVLGAGCKSCHEQHEYAKTAVRNLGLDVDVEYITDMEKIMEYGVMSMPAIVVNEKLVSAGKVLKPADVEKLLKN